MNNKSLRQLDAQQQHKSTRKHVNTKIGLNRGNCHEKMKSHIWYIQREHFCEVTTL